QLVARDTEPEILCDLVRDRDTLHDPADIRDPDQVDGAVLVERGLRAPEIHEEDGPSFIRGGTLIADDVCHRGVDERLVRCPVEQGEVLTGGRVQVGRGTSVREHVVRSERARVERPSVARRERTEGPFIRGVQPHHGDLLVPFVARDVSDRHHLQQGGSDSVHRAFCGNQVRANLGEVRLREREELAAELVRDNFVDGTEPDIDVFEEDVTQCIADDEAGGNDRRADEEPEDYDDHACRPASDVPRRESCEERPGREQEPGQGDADNDHEQGHLREGHAAQALRVSSTICPFRIRRIRWARELTIASWVTRTRVCRCSRFKWTRRSMICADVSESRLPVGSSAHTIAGSFTRARAIATRCCCPALSCAGWCPAHPLSSTCSMRTRAFRRASFAGTFATRRGSSTFSAAVRTGRRLYDWNTNPIRRERYRLFASSSMPDRETPSI